MLLWGKMCAYLLSKDTFYYSASIKDKGYEKYIFWCLKVIQSHRKKIWVSTVHHVGEINCQTLKKTDSFWNNIPPGKCDPYMEHPVALPFAPFLSHFYTITRPNAPATGC